MEDPGPAMMKFATWSKKRLSDTSANASGEEETDAPKHKKQRKEDAADSRAASSTCIICVSKPIACAFVPCGHMCCCMRCAVLVESSGCPICRETIAMPLKVYT